MVEIRGFGGPIGVQEVFGLTDAQRGAYRKIGELARRIPPSHQFGRWDVRSQQMGRLLRKMVNNTGLPDPLIVLAYRGFGLR